MSDEKIIERIKKLLRLSEDPTNEHVAEAAAQKAQELIEEHNIKSEMFADKESPTREDPKWQGFIVHNRRVQTWMVTLCDGLCSANYGRLGITSGEGIQFLGAKSDYDIVVELYNWIVKQLHAMATNKGLKGVREYNSYKLGASTTIKKRLIKAKQDAKEKLELEALWEEANAGKKNELVLFRQAIIALEDYTKKVNDQAKRDLGGAWRGGSVASDASAYAQGVSDGQHVSLNAGGYN
jgi:hypothetical protein